MKTGKEIYEDFVDNIIAISRDNYDGDSIGREIRGKDVKVYQAGMRPREDWRAVWQKSMEVALTYAEPGQVESGTLTVMVFLCDISDKMVDGAPVEDTERTKSVERQLADLAERLTPDRTGGYLYKPLTIPQTFASPETGEHFVSIKIGYKYYER